MAFSEAGPVLLIYAEHSKSNELSQALKEVESEMARELPPLGALRAFEAASRHLSFARAGNEIGLTPGAISHQVRLLEQWLGLDLFERTPNGVMLTPIGKDYGASLKLILDQVIACTSRARSSGKRRRISVHCQVSFAAKWLAPKLAGFLDAYPDIDVDVIAAPQVPDWTEPDGDVFIYYSKGSTAGIHQERVLSCHLTVFAAPSLMPTMSGAFVLSDLLRHRFIHLNYVDNGWPEPGWREWLNAAQCFPGDLPPGPAFELIHLGIEACVAGTGFGLFPTAFVTREMSAGLLCQPFNLLLPAPYDYCLIIPEANLQRSEIVAFRNWLRDAAAPISHSSA